MTDTLLTHRCPLCRATCNDADATVCPDCGHGLVAFEVTLHA